MGANIANAAIQPMSELYSDVASLSGVESSVSDSSTVTYRDGSSISYSSTNFGVNHAYAQAVGSVSVGSDSVWYDSFTYTGATGSFAQVNVSSFLNGSNQQTAPGGVGGGEYDLVAYRSWKSIGTLLSWIDSPNNAYNLSMLGSGAVLLGHANLDDTGNYNLVLNRSLNVAAGDTWYIASILSVGADADATVDFAHSAHFGISAANGLSVVAASGTVYPDAVGAVPEPATIALSLLGLGFMGLRGRAHKN